MFILNNFNLRTRSWLHSDITQTSRRLTRPSSINNNNSSHSISRRIFRLISLSYHLAACILCHPSKRPSLTNFSSLLTHKWCNLPQTVKVLQYKSIFNNHHCSHKWLIHSSHSHLSIRTHSSCSCSCREENSSRSCSHPLICNQRLSRCSSNSNLCNNNMLRLHLTRPINSSTHSNRCSSLSRPPTCQLHKSTPI